MSIPRTGFFIFLLLFCLTGVASAAPLSFDENGEFTILVVADTQDNDHPQHAMLSLLNASLNVSDPDLVVFLGDQLNGYSIRDIEGPFINDLLNSVGEMVQEPYDFSAVAVLFDLMFPSLVGDDPDKVKAGINAIVAPLQERGIPFAVVFGNHDDQGSLSKDEQYAIYTSYDNCQAWSVPNLTGKSNYNLLINGSDGAPAFNLWFFDSGTYAPEGGIGHYAWVAEDQIRWYQQTSDSLNAQNGGEPLPAFAFQHIIVPEIYDLLLEVPADTSDAFKGKGIHNDRYYIANPEYITAGSVNEAPAPPDYNSGEFTAWKNQGDIIAAFFGHDHDNDFFGTWKGIDLVATPGIGFFIYGNGEYHGTRMITLYEDDLQNYSTKLLYYKDIVSEPLPGGIISTYGFFVQQILLTVLVFMAGIVACIVLLVWVIRREKKRK